MRLDIALTFVALSSVVAGCTSTGTRWTSERSSDLSRYVLNDSVTAVVEWRSFICDWAPHPPARTRIIADLSLRAGEYNRIATAVDSAAVESSGGRVLYAFSVARLRVELDTSAVRALIQSPGGIATAAYAVTDTSQHIALVQVFFRQAASDADVASVEQLGVDMPGGNWDGTVWTAWAPDRVINQIAALPQVRFVREQAMLCGGR